jgi:cystathionine beta-lyase/cystathionine gamma-synthase
MKLINNWDELALVPETATHRLEIEDGCGWIISKAKSEYDDYLSTHTFYGSTYQSSTKLLQKYGFDVQLANWDA